MNDDIGDRRIVIDRKTAVTAMLINPIVADLKDYDCNTDDFSILLLLLAAAIEGSMNWDLCGADALKLMAAKGSHNVNTTIKVTPYCSA